MIDNTKQMKSQTHQTHTTFQYIASDEIIRRVIPCEREKKYSRGRYGQTVNERWIVVTLCPSFCWPEVLQWRACPLKQAKGMWGPPTAAHQALSPHPGHGRSQPCALHSTPAAPGSPRDRVHSLHKCHKATFPDQCCRPALWQSSFLPVLLWHGQEQLHCCRANRFKRQEQFPNDTGHCP